jgi:hypothetical protein
VYYGKRKEILREKNEIKEQTMALRRQQYYQAVGV